MHIGIGFSKASNSYVAAKEASLLAKLEAKQDKIDLAIVFCSIYYNAEEVLRAVKEILPEAKIAGCSAAGIILSSGIENQGVAVLGIKSNRVSFGLGVVKDVSPKEERSKGQDLAKSSLESLGAHKKDVFMMFSDGFIANSSELIRGVQDVLGKSFPCIGGASSGDFNLDHTYQFFQTKVLTNSGLVQSCSQ